MRKLMAEEITDARPKACFPVVEAFEPGSLVDPFRWPKRSLVAERMKLTEVLDELHGIVNAVNPKFERVDVSRIEMDLERLIRSKTLAGAQIERDRLTLGMRGLKTVKNTAAAQRTLYDNQTRS